MAAVWFRARSELRRRRAASLALVFLIGIAGAAVLASAAGARRGDRALPTFLAEQRPPHAAVATAEESADPTMARERALLADLPYVEATSRAAPVVVAEAGSRPAAGAQRRLAVVGIDRGALGRFGTPIVLDGRMPDDGSADEATVDEELADRAGLAVGSTYRVATFTSAQTGALGGSGAAVAPLGPVVDLRVVGVVRFPHDLIPVRTDQDNLYVQRGDLYLTPAFWERYGPDLAGYGVAVLTDLAGGASEIDRLERDVPRLLGPLTLVTRIDPEAGVVDLPLDGVRRGIDLETRALQAFAALAGVAGLLVVGQSLARQVAEEVVDAPLLRAVGMTRREVVGAAVLRGALVGAAGAAVAVVGAVALSPLLPLGLARRATRDPGIDVDVAVLGVGALAVVLVVTGCTLLAAVAAGRTTSRTVRLGLLGRAAGLGLPAAAWTGVALARRRGWASLPLRTALVATTVAVLAGAAAAGYGASLDRLHEEPARYGVTWDVSVGNSASPEEAAAAEERLASNRMIAAYSGVTGVDLLVDGEAVPTLVAFPGRQSVPPRVVEGAAPQAADEIGLGSETLEAVGAEVGDTVQVAAQDGAPAPFRITGRIVLNSAGIDDRITPGEGGLVTSDAATSLAPGLAEITVPQSFLIRFRQGVDRGGAGAQLERDFPGFVVRPLTSDEIDNVTRVSGLPTVLAGLVAALGAGAVLHALLTTVRRRRRDFAVLKCLGFARRQVVAIIAWQAVGLAAVALLVGLPLGVAAGRWAWGLTAEALGVVGSPVVPGVTLAVLVLTVLAVVHLAAAAPALLVRRLAPAAALRTE